MDAVEHRVDPTLTTTKVTTTTAEKAEGRQEERSDGRRTKAREGQPWSVLVACFVCNITTASAGYHAGVLHVALLDTFHQDVVTTAWLSSLYASLFALPGPLGSLLINQFDCRTCLLVAGAMTLTGFTACFFTYDFFYLYPALILAGTGQGLTLLAIPVALSYHFPRHVSLVTGVCICAGGLGIFIHPPLLQVLLDKYGLRGALLIVGAVAAHVVPCGLAVIPSQFETQRRHASPGPAPARQKRYAALAAAGRLRSSLTALADTRYLLLLAAGVACSMGTSAYYLYIPDFLLRHGHSAITASFVASATGAGSAISRFLTGVASSDERVDIRLLYLGSHVLTGLTVVLVPWLAGSAVAQLALGVMFGLYSGIMWSAYSPLLLQLLGVQRLATAAGVFLFMFGVAYLGGGPAAGWLYTTVDNLNYIFHFSGAMYGLASLAVVLSVSTKGSNHSHQDKVVCLESPTHLYDEDHHLMPQHCDIDTTKSQSPNQYLITLGTESKFSEDVL